MNLADLLIDEQLPDWLRQGLKEGKPIQMGDKILLDQTVHEDSSPHGIVISYDSNHNLVIEDY